MVADSPPLWLWPNLLALDAPIVAVVWQRFVALTAGIDAPLAATVTLALVVWGVYLTDRCLDARRGRATCTDRHQFASRNPQIMAGLAMCVLATAGAFAAVELPVSYLISGGVVAVVLAGYLAAVHLVRATGAWVGGLKEFAVGVVFAAGASVPLLAEAHPTVWGWAPGVIAFGGLCVLNCLLISRWEEPPTAAPWGGMCLAAGSIAVAAALAADSPVAIAVLAGVGLLTGLHLARAWFSTRALRVLADVVLLTPLGVMGTWG